jgi:hypothetical protein
MNYHLNQQGQTVGVFPLEELCRRRSAGQLTGSELVWCEGMTEWQPLDVVLQREIPGAVAVPPPLPKPKSKRVVAVTVVAISVAVVTAFIVCGILACKAVRRVQRVVIREAASSGWLGTGRTALEEASKPVQWTTNTSTNAKLLTMQREFRVRQYVDGYKNGNDHQSPCDADARRLIEIWIDSHFGGKLQTNFEALVEQADGLATNPACDDPLVWTVLGANINEMHEQVRRFDLAVKGYEHSRYKAYPRFYATVALAKYLANLHRDPERVRQLDWSAKKLLKEALQDGSIRPEDQTEIAEIMLDGWGSEFFMRNAATVPPIVEAAGKPFQWLSLVLKGESEVEAAWHARGDEFADKVTAEGWRGFREHLAKAREDFTKAWELRPDLAYAPACMVTVSLGNSGISEMRLWFDRTVSAQFDFAGAWNQMRWGLRPRWYGDLESMLAFGVMAANTRRYDTDVPRKFFDSVSDIEQELKLPVGQHIYGRKDIWPHLQEMYEGYIAETSEVRNQDGWHTAYSIIAFLADKLDIARTQLEAVHWNPRRENFENWGRDLSLMPLEVAARTGVASQQVNAAEADYGNRDLAGALKVYQQVSADAALDERTHAFANERLASIGMEQRLQAGDWVDFLPDTNALTGWTVERGKCSRTTDGALEVETGEPGHIVFARGRVGNNFEVKGRFDVVRSSNNSFQGGLVFGLPQFDSQTWYGFRIKRNPDEGDVVSFAEGWSTSQLVRKVPLDSQSNSFYLSIHHGLVTARVNDQLVFENAKPPERFRYTAGDCYLGLGAYSDANQTVIRYHDVQVRQLSDH